MTATKCHEMQTWLSCNGISWDSDAIEIVDAGVVGGLGVLSKRCIKPGEILAYIPKAAVLSVRNTRIAGLIQSEELGLDVGLRFAIAYEQAIGDKSKWWGYFASLSSGYERLPYLFEDQDRQALLGTDAEDTVKETLTELQEEYVEVIKPLLKHPDVQGYTITLKAYLHAASLASSRAFAVDDFHLEALVPLADIFNHVCQRVPQNETVAETRVSKDPTQRRDPSDAVLALTEGTACSTHPLGVSQVAANKCERSGSILPFARWEGDVPLMQIGLAEETSCVGTKRRKQGTGPSGHMIIYVLTDILARTEIFNTYGEFSNDKLLQDYGFVLEQNAFNTVTLARSSLQAAAERCMGSQKCTRRMEFASETAEMLGIAQEEDDAENAESDANEDEEEENEVEDAADKDGDKRDNESEEATTDRVATFFELKNDGKLPRGLLALLVILHAGSRFFKTLRSLPPSALRTLIGNCSQERILRTHRCRRILRASLLGRLQAYPKPVSSAADDRAAWANEGSIGLDRNSSLRRDGLGLRISEKEILEHHLRLCRSLAPVSKSRKIMLSRVRKIEKYRHTHLCVL